MYNFQNSPTEEWEKRTEIEKLFLFQCYMADVFKMNQLYKFTHPLNLFRVTGVLELIPKARGRMHPGQVTSLS